MNLPLKIGAILVLISLFFSGAVAREDKVKGDSIPSVIHEICISVNRTTVNYELTSNEYGFGLLLRHSLNNKPKEESATNSMVPIS